MGNSQGKAVQKKEVITKLSPTQRAYIESWYCVLCDEESRTIPRSAFLEDVEKRFANIPNMLLTALFDCMNPDSKENIKEDAFFYMAYVIFNGNFEERLQLTYMIIQRLGKDTEVTVESLLLFFNLVNLDTDSSVEWTGKRMLEALEAGSSTEEIISWERFDKFCSKNPTCPIVSWMQYFCKLIEEACVLHQRLADDESNGNQRYSRVFYTTKKTIIYNHIRDISLSVLMEIYGTLIRSSNTGYITKAQWYSEMSKFFPQQLVQRCACSLHLTHSVFIECSENQERISVYTVISAMCLLCHDPIDQRIRGALHVFRYNQQAVDQFSHADLVKLFSSGVDLFDVDNSFDCTNDDPDDEHIHTKRRLSQDDQSHHSVSVSVACDV